MILIRCDQCKSECDLRERDQHYKVTIEDWIRVTAENGDRLDLCHTCGPVWLSKEVMVGRYKGNPRIPDVEVW